MNLFFRRGSIAAIALLPLAFACPVALADEIDSEALAEARVLMKSGREEMMRGEMQLTESEAGDFWPVYEQYRSEVEIIRDRQTKMISTYVEAYWAAELSDDLAKDVLDEHFAISTAILKVEKKYLRKFRKILPVGKVTRFYQLESKLQAQVDIVLADLVPLFETS
jgi:hypothetical protein